LTVDKKLLRQN